MSRVAKSSGVIHLRKDQKIKKKRKEKRKKKERKKKEEVEDPRLPQRNKQQQNKETNKNPTTSFNIQSNSKFILLDTTMAEVK